MSDSSDVVIPQSAAIPFRIEAGSPRVLLIKTRGGKRWIVPKGIVEEWQSPRETAVEEALEEAGVKGELVGDSVGCFEYEKWGGVCRVDVFLMRVDDVLSDWLEDFRERKWVSVDEACKLVDNAGLGRLIKTAAGRMN